MRHAILMVTLLGLCLTCGCNGTNKIQTGQHSMALNRQVVMEMDYLLYVPDDYGKEQKDWPLIVFLHGAGERGSNLDKVKGSGLAKLAERGEYLPFIIVSPRCKPDKWWANYGEQIMAIIDETVENYNVDESRIYLTGSSLGGYGTWSIACAYPERFAAIAPICGGGHPFVVHNLKNIPVWAFHGAKDNVVPLSESQRMVNAVNKAGGNAKLTVYPDVGHGSGNKAYNDKELYKWFLSYQKK